MSSTPLRLLFISHTFPPADRPLSSVGGMQRVATELHAALGRRSDVTLQTLALRTSWRQIYLRTPPFLVRCAQHLLSTQDVDLVLCSSALSAAFLHPFWAPLQARGTAIAAIAHGEDVLCPAPGYRSLVQRSFAHLDGVIAVSRATGKACLENGLQASKLRVIANGVDDNRFPPLHAPAQMRAELLDTSGQHLPDDAFLLCSIGRHVPRKGFTWFVDNVMPNLPANVHYWLGGSGPDSAAIVEAARRRGLSQRVRLLGRLDEQQLVQLYRGSDLYVMPNIAQPGTMEGFGVVMLEAGMCGLHTVASRLEGICDVVEEGTNGALVASGDSAAFAAAIERYAEQRIELQRSAARVVERTRAFSWTTIAQHYVDAARQLQARRAHSAMISARRRVKAATVALAD